MSHNHLGAGILAEQSQGEARYAKLAERSQPEEDFEIQQNEAKRWRATLNSVGDIIEATLR